MSKENYERPIIIKHQSGLANKFGRSRTVKTMAQIDGMSVKSLSEKYGSPLFVFSERTIRENYQNALRAFSLRYPKVQFAWSYKTNYLDAICKIFHDEGSWAEVVSEYEYEMAKRNGMSGNKILFNGPYKPYQSLKTAVKDDARIHIDHYEELYTLEKIAEEENIIINVTLRLNMDTGIYPSWDRFGFNYDNNEALDAARRIYAGKKLKVTGVHAHIGTFIIEPSAYRVQVEKLVEFSKRIEAEMGFRVEYIDIGGGFPSNSTLHSMYISGEEANPPIDAYAEAITSALLAGNFDPDKLPMLVLETGRSLIDSAGYAITTVAGNKRLANGTRSIIIDAGVNILFTSFWYKHNIYPVEEKSGLFEETIVYGPLCMNIDVIQPSLRLPSLVAGDLLVIAPVGAYNVTQWLQFIRMRPGVVLIGMKGEIEEIRLPETVDFIKTPERTPEWIKRKNAL